MRASYPKGHLQNPMSDDEVAAKFMQACTPRLGGTRAQHALALLWDLENQVGLDGLFSAFAQA